MLLCRRLQNQLKVFVHQAQWKLRTVVVDRGPFQLPHMSRSDDRGLRQDFEQPFAIEADFLPEDHRLSDRLHANAQQRVDDQLHRGSRARTAEKKVSFGDRLKYWLGGEEQFWVAAGQQREGASFGGRRATRDGDVQYLDTGSGAEPMHFS